MVKKIIAVSAALSLGFLFLAAPSDASTKTRSTSTVKVTTAPVISMSYVFGPDLCC
ncbi:MAG: hypothetical protein WCP64_03015 [Actinomycetes bacterium]